MRRFALVFTAMMLALLCSNGIATAQSSFFEFTGQFSGGAFSEVRGLSADGVIATGATNVPQLGYRGFRWTRAGGRMDFDSAQGFATASRSIAISGDGSAIVGIGGSTGLPEAFRWRGPGQIDNLGILPTYNLSEALGVSGNGELVVGVNRRSSGLSRAFLWTAQSGMQALGSPFSAINLEATAVSRDGSTIVGWTAGEGTDALVWASAGGVGTPLPQLPGSTLRAARAFAVNHDGSIIVGSAGNVTHPVVWTDGQIAALGLPTGTVTGTALGVSDSGAVVGGQVFNGTNNLAAVWTSAGPQYLTDYLVDNGVALPTGLVLTACYAVSADGLTFGGIGYAPGFPTQGFVARVPSGGTGLVFGLGVVLRARRSLRP